jgi:lysozyme family protein
MPQSIARVIYRAKYWDSVKADQLPEILQYPVFDAAVNSGVAQSARWLQRAAMVRDDGVIGPITIKALEDFNANIVLRRMLAQRLKFMTDLAGWPVFSRGWARRIAELMEAL